MSKQSDQCDWPKCKTIVGAGEGLVYYGKLLCERHVKKLWSLIDAGRRDEVLDKLHIRTQYNRLRKKSKGR